MVSGLMSEFVVRRLMGDWAVTNNGVILSCRTRVPDAIKMAVESAATSAQSGMLTRVVVEDARAERRIVWQSDRDSFSQG